MRTRSGVSAFHHAVNRVQGRAMVLVFMQWGEAVAPVVAVVW